MPYNIWCEHCNSHIGKGVRYNAEKKCIGKYFSTKIWSFRMKCHLCSGWMEINTDPKSADYVIVSGAKRKTETWEPGADATIALLDEEEHEKLQVDPFFKLEHLQQDESKAEQEAPEISFLYQWRDERSKDDYLMSRKLRSKFRTEKKRD